MLHIHLCLDVYVMHIEVKKERGKFFNPLLPCVSSSNFSLKKEFTKRVNVEDKKLTVSILKNMLLLGHTFQLFSIQEKCLKLNLNMLN